MRIYIKVRSFPQKLCKGYSNPGILIYINQSDIRSLVLYGLRRLWRFLEIEKNIFNTHWTACVTCPLEKLVKIYFVDCKQCGFRPQPASLDMQNGNETYIESMKRKLGRVTVEEDNEKWVCKCRRIWRSPLQNT